MSAAAPLGIGVVGCGHWGPNYVRNFIEMEGIGKVVCCDTDAARLQRLKQRFPGVETVTDFHRLLADTAVGAVVVATPADTHFSIVRDCLAHGRDVLAEKPITLVPEQALELHKLAVQAGRILMVGHTFIYNPGIRKLKELIDRGDLGRIYYLNATRTHLGLLRNDVNVIWDLAPHDVAIFNYLLGASPVGVSTMAACHLKKDREDVAFINLAYPNGVIANIHVSWEDSNKERTVRVVGSKARAVFDDIDNLERVKIYEKGIGPTGPCNDFGEFQLSLRDGDIVSPKIGLFEPLREMCTHFVDCVRTRRDPLTNGMSGYEVVKVMADIMAGLRRA